MSEKRQFVDFLEDAISAMEKAERFAGDMSYGHRFASTGDARILTLLPAGASRQFFRGLDRFLPFQNRINQIK